MRHIAVLLVEDNTGDVFFIRQALASEPFPITVHVASDGEKAIQMLATRGRDLDLVILDLNIPKVSGLSVLERSRPHMPVVVFSSSKSDDEIRRCFELGARDFVPKPHDLESYTRAVSYIIQKWGSEPQVAFHPTEICNAEASPAESTMAL